MAKKVLYVSDEYKNKIKMIAAKKGIPMYELVEKMIDKYEGVIDE